LLRLLCAYLQNKSSVFSFFLIEVVAPYDPEVSLIKNHTQRDRGTYYTNLYFIHYTYTLYKLYFIRNPKDLENKFILKEWEINY